MKEMMKYDARFAAHDTACRARHGLKWTPAEVSELKALFSQLNLRDLCEALQRPATGVLTRLCAIGLLKKDIRFGSCSYDYYYATTPSKPGELTPPPTKEITMPAPTIETKTFIAGREAKDMTDDEIFSLIAKLESSADKLTQIRHKPKKLVASIEKLEADIHLLVAYVDSRE